MSPVELTILAVVLLLVVAIAVAIAYNLLVRRRELVAEGWSGIDVQLKRRHDLIPSLVAVVEGYSEFEKGTLKEVIEARGAAADRLDQTRAGDHTPRADSMHNQQDAENALAERLRTLFVLIENYPQLKADAQFTNLSSQLVETEDLLQHARRYYNGAVRDYNTLASSFPVLLIAGALGFSPREYFQVEPVLRESAPQVAISQAESE